MKEFFELRFGNHNRTIEKSFEITFWKEIAMKKFVAAIAVLAIVTMALPALSEWGTCTVSTVSAAEVQAKTTNVSVSPRVMSGGQVQLARPQGVRVMSGGQVRLIRLSNLTERVLQRQRNLEARILGPPKPQRPEADAAVKASSDDRTLTPASFKAAVSDEVTKLIQELRREAPKPKPTPSL